MKGAMAFSGFSPWLLDFLRELSLNNTRDWFRARCADYQRYVLQPAWGFVVAMGACLVRALAADIHAEPRVHGSILASGRDTRFSPDKSPYKTHLDLWFWRALGGAPNRDCPGYVLRITSEAVMLGAGVQRFFERAQSAYRRAVQTPGHAEWLGQTEWLKHTGLDAGRRLPLPEARYSEPLAGWPLAHYRRLAPLRQWLIEILRE